MAASSAGILWQSVGLVALGATLATLALRATAPAPAAAASTTRFGGLLGFTFDGVRILTGRIGVGAFICRFLTVIGALAIAVTSTTTPTASAAAAATTRGAFVRVVLGIGERFGG